VSIFLNEKRQAKKVKEFASYVSCKKLLNYGHETWPMKMKHEVRLDRNEVSMIRWTCGFTLSERNKTTDLRK